jgi:hypothetical protein
MIISDVLDVGAGEHDTHILEDVGCGTPGSRTCTA